MLKMLKEVLKMDRLTGGLVVESLGECQSGKQYEVDIWPKVDMEQQ